MHGLDLQWQARSIDICCCLLSAAAEVAAGVPAGCCCLGLPCGYTAGLHAIKLKISSSA